MPDRQQAFTLNNSEIVNFLRSSVSLRSGENKIDGVALWDTGATCSVISKVVAEKLKLTSLGKERIRTPSGESVCDVYLIDIVLPNNLDILNFKVMDSEIGKQGLDLLVGMDIISKGDFAVSNFDGKTTFTFRTPSQKKTDYVAQLAAKNTIGKPKGRPHNGKKKK